jgi:hypothetical protein
MPSRPFLVLRNHECVPLEGAYRVETHDDTWYVLGHNEAHMTSGESEARALLERLRDDEEAHRLASEALEGLSGEFEVQIVRR